jgi:hypothetical protein
MSLLTSSDFCADGAGTIFASLEHERPPARRWLFAASDRDLAFAPIEPPGPVKSIAAGGGYLAAAGEGIVYRSGDRGRSWMSLPAPLQPRMPLAYGESVLWVGDRAGVLTANGDHLVERWRLPPGDAGQVSGLFPVGPDHGLVLTNQGRVFRAHPGAAMLEDFSAGLPPPPGPNAFNTVSIGRLRLVYLAFVGALYFRRDGDASWARADSAIFPDLAGVIASRGARWVEMMSSPDIWIGSDGLRTFMSGPGRPLTPLWQPPVVGRHYVKDLSASPAGVFVSMLRVTAALAGVVVRDGGQVEAISLPLAHSDEPG